MGVWGGGFGGRVFTENPRRGSPRRGGWVELPSMRHVLGQEQRKSIQARQTLSKIPKIPYFRSLMVGSRQMGSHANGVGRI